MRVSTKEKILEISKDLIQKVGSNAFSYQDIANKLKIKKASIHYYFPKKNDLLLELMKHYRSNLELYLKQIEISEKSFKKRLALYLDMYHAMAKNNKQICLCGVLAGEIMTLPKIFKKELKAFFDIHEDWLKKLYEDAKKKKELKSKKNPRSLAKGTLSSLQGALIISRVQSESKFIEDVIDSYKI